MNEQQYQPPRLIIDNSQTRVARLKGGGSDGTYDGMEHRVAALEKGFDRIERKLDTLISDVADVKGQLKAMPTAIAFGELKGRVDSLPTTAKIASIIGAAGVLLTIVTKWTEIKGVLGF